MKAFFFLLMFLPCIVFSQTKHEYKNLVLEGGGVRGLAYSGALEVLEQRGILQDIERVAGSSAGAIAGLMVALGYNSCEIDSVLQTLKIQEFNDGKFFIGKIKRIRKEYGFYKGDKFEAWLKQIIQFKTGDANTSFEDLYQLHLTNKNFKEFYCTGTNVTLQRLETFSRQTRPYMKLSTAVRISGCIPFYFKPVPIDDSGKEVAIFDTLSKYNLFVDGGMLCNYPISMFDSSLDGSNPLTSEKLIYNPQTLGLKLERGDQIEEFDNNNMDIAPYQIHSMKQYTGALMNLMMETLNRKSPDLKNEKGRTIYISYGDFSGKLRKVSSKEKRLLHDNGSIAVNKFFAEPIAGN